MTVKLKLVFMLVIFVVIFATYFFASELKIKHFLFNTDFTMKSEYSVYSFLDQHRQNLIKQKHYRGPNEKLTNVSLDVKLSDWLNSVDNETSKLVCQPDLASLNKERFRIDANITLRELLSPSSVSNSIENGGTHRPSDCKPPQRLAVIVPYRDREKHLDIFVNNLHPMLHRQNLFYGIFVVEVTFPTQFNGGMLKNIGYDTAKRLGRYNCFVFHDVDLIPVNEFNMYACEDKPVHLSSNNTKYSTGIPYPEYLGGVVMFSDDQYAAINGYSNAYFGWGAEDDDLRNRIKAKQIGLNRRDKSVGKYFALSHKIDETNPINIHNHDLLRTSVKRMDVDGLNSLKYEVKALEFRPLYTWILADINEVEVMSEISI